MNNKRSKTATHRIPYYRAPFYFGPEYLAKAEEWQRSFQRLSEKILQQNACGGRVIEVHGHSIMIGWGALELTIDARLGRFEIWENDGREDDDPSSDCWGGLETVPSSFIGEIRSALIPERLTRRILVQIIPFAEAIFRETNKRFERALRENIAEIQVRPLSPGPDTRFVRLDPESRRYFPLDFKQRELTQDDADELDDATGPNGEKLYSYGVVASRRPPTVNLPNDVEVCASSVDGRVHHDWNEIDQIIIDEYGQMLSKPLPSRTRLYVAVELRLDDRSPSRTEIFERFKKLNLKF